MGGRGRKKGRIEGARLCGGAAMVGHQLHAHGDHMFLAGQSSKMPMEHQHQWASTLVGRAPDLSAVID